MTLKLDALDRQMLAALDPDFAVDDNNEVATISGPITIKIVRTADDRLQLMIEFSEQEFPILLSRSQTLRQLNMVDES